MMARWGSSVAVGLPRPDFEAAIVRPVPTAPSSRPTLPRYTAARRLAMCLDQATSPPAANETGIANLTREYRILLDALGLTPKALRELAVDSEPFDVSSWLMSGLDVPT